MKPTLLGYSSVQLIRLTTDSVDLCKEYQIQGNDKVAKVKHC